MLLGESLGRVDAYGGRAACVSAYSVVSSSVVCVRMRRLVCISLVAARHLCDAVQLCSGL